MSLYTVTHWLCRFTKLPVKDMYKYMPNHSFTSMGYIYPIVGGVYKIMPSSTSTLLDIHLLTVTHFNCYFSNFVNRVLSINIILALLSPSFISLYTPAPWHKHSWPNPVDTCSCNKNCLRCTCTMYVGTYKHNKSYKTTQVILQSMQLSL